MKKELVDTKNKITESAISIRDNEFVFSSCKNYCHKILKYNIT